MIDRQKYCSTRDGGDETAASDQAAAEGPDDVGREFPWFMDTRRNSQPLYGVIARLCRVVRTVPN